MRVVHGLCEARYSGRGDTVLPLFERMILLKQDGTVAIHSNTSIKPLNYMNGGAKGSMVETMDAFGRKVWIFENSKENLTITFDRIFSDMSMDIPEGDPGLEYDGTEDQIQEFLSNNINILNENFDFVQREYRTDNGPVDLLAFDKGTGKHVLIEVKRVATMSALHQLKRYCDGVTDFEEFDSLLVALDIRPKTREKALKMGTPWIQLRKDDVHVGCFTVDETSEDNTNAEDNPTLPL